jgi:DNA-binding CsgD family transcriptional regulator
MIHQTRQRPEDLTKREHEVLQLVWEGLSNQAIAEHLKISVKTSEAHRSNMMRKLRVSNIAQLLKAALEGGLIASYILWPTRPPVADDLLRRRTRNLSRGTTVCPM